MITTNPITVSDILLHLGFQALTPMQEAMRKAWGAKQDIVLLSPTGTGKTLAYLLPLVQELKPDVKEIQAIVLAPSRELVRQTEQVFRSMGTSLGVMSCYGGRPTMEEHRQIRAVHPVLLIATPGRLGDHLRKGNLDASTVRTLIIDEFDKCLELGFQDEMEEILTYLPNLQRRLLLSATDAEQIPHFVGLSGDWNKTIRLDFLQGDIPEKKRLEIRLIRSPQKDKLDTLYALLRTLGTSSTMVFANYRESVDRMAGFLRKHGIYGGAFHGGMEQDERERTLYKFCNGTLPVLISTDLAARGLDIERVENIVHYHLPSSLESFTHRNGRTARWDAAGTAYILLGPDEACPEWLPEEITEATLPESLPPVMRPVWSTIYIGKGKKDKLSRADVVGFLCKKGGLNRNELGRVDVLPHFSLAAVRRERLSQVLRLVQGEKIKGLKTRIEEAL